MLRWTRIAIVGFGLAALAFSIVSSDQLVLLARVSFNGTALLGPLVLGGIFFKRAPGVEVLYATGAGLVLFLGSVVNWVPDMVGPLRLDLLLLVVLGLVTVGSAVARQRELVSSTVPAPAVTEGAEA